MTRRFKSAVVVVTVSADPEEATETVEVAAGAVTETVPTDAVTTSVAVLAVVEASATWRSTRTSSVAKRSPRKSRQRNRGSRFTGTWRLSPSSEYAPEDRLRLQPTWKGSEVS